VYDVDKNVPSPAWQQMVDEVKAEFYQWGMTTLQI
jgi:hypothetical protein